MNDDEQQPDWERTAVAAMMAGAHVQYQLNETQHDLRWLKLTVGLAGIMVIIGSVLVTWPTAGIGNPLHRWAAVGLMIIGTGLTEAGLGWIERIVDQLWRAAGWVVRKVVTEPADRHRRS